MSINSVSAIAESTISESRTPFCSLLHLTAGSSNSGITFTFILESNTCDKGFVACNHHHVIDQILWKAFACIQQETPLPFLTDVTLSRIVVVAVNMWIGIPYTMMTFSGVLMNVPEELYESASIDGAGPVRRFISITLPYMVFVTAPATITTFVGNINNFNVIYLLTAGGPASLDYYQAGKTDLLVTWLYKLTVDQHDYALASTIGIFIFMIVSVCSLAVYNRTGAVKKEDMFQ